jgi:hypothetical protein
MNTNRLNESMDRIKFMMNYDTSYTMTENVSLDIDTRKHEGVLFDFVICESAGFVIYMDHVFSKKHGFIGDLWENTWVFNEIIKENINKYSSVIIENVKKDFDTLLYSIQWTKEFVSECMLDNTIQEGFILDEQFFDKLKSGISSATSAISKGVKGAVNYVGDFGKKLLTGPILGSLRWIRRNIYTNAGMIIDIVTSMLPATTGINKIVWVMIVILDIWEIATKNFDPKDTDRLQNPYMFLITDLIGATFTVFAGNTAKQSLKAAAKGGKKLPSQVAKFLDGILKQAPKLKSTLTSTGRWLSKNMPTIKKIVDVVLGFVDRVLQGVVDFIKQLLSRQGATAVATASAITWFLTPRLLKLGDSGNDIGVVNDYISNYYNVMFPDIFAKSPDCELNQEIINKVKNSGNKFTKDTEDAVKKIEFCVSKHLGYDFVKVDGKISDKELIIYGVEETDDRGVKKFVPHTVRQGYNDVVGRIMSGANQFLEDKFGSIKTN